MFEWVTYALTWTTAHPMFAALVVWPIVSGFVTWVFGSHTDEEYAAMGPTLARAIKLIAGLGIDTPKVLAALKKQLKVEDTTDDEPPTNHSI